MTLETILQELRAETPEEAQVRAAAAFDRVAAPFENRIVLFGAGHLGQFALAGLRLSGIEPLAFCDNNPYRWNTQCNGIPVLSPADAMRRYNDSATFVITIYTASGPRKQLEELGCERLASYHLLFWKYWRTMVNENRIDPPHRILERADEMAAGYDLLSDEQSRREFSAQIRWRCLLDFDCLPTPNPASETYFPPELVALLPDEVFVDCGAFDGDSIRAFLAASGRQFGRIYGWEADSSNLAALRAYREREVPDTAARIEIVPYAVGERNEVLRFAAEGWMGSKFSELEAAQEVPCRTIDSIFANARPTYIKMDIEGAEPGALRGAMKTMAQSRPVMAVCAYHACDHLWIIPQLLKKGNPDYEIFLRRYSEECWETVYYAIPPERLLRAKRT